MREDAKVTDDGRAWWRSAVIYQVYIRSFADSDGDGLGDIAGIRSRLRYLVELGVDAIWINPWYPSPMADAGYDVSDYRGIEPRFGTLADAEALVHDAHEQGIRVLLDVVPNHTSDQHPWFQAALTAGPGSPQRQRYYFRSGRGDGSLPPNDWRSTFGGPAWTRILEPDEQAGEWYLHLFAPEQPDVDWNHPDVRADFESTLRFWFDRGVDGFRIDVANSLIKEADLPNVGDLGHLTTAEDVAASLVRTGRPAHPHWDRDEVHEVYRAWRVVADSYAEPRVFVAEAWVHPPERLARYVRSDELHTAFNFGYLRSPWIASALRASIEETLVQHSAVGAPPTWVLSNHDVARHVSRYARVQTAAPMQSLEDLAGRPADLQVGLRRARAAALLTLALPGGAYIYQGEELGLPEVEDLPDEALQDPTWERSGHADRGRDGCRVPIPWAGDEPPFGFSPDDAAAPPWLPQPAAWKTQTVEALSGDPDSILELYRAALRIRREHPALGDGPLRWLDTPIAALGFSRDPGFTCLLNVGSRPIPLPAGSAILLASGPLGANRQLPADTAVWLTPVS